ncbi:kielin/chordin-like protein isoform X2 [Diabrotica virgifera virgifera]|uniref:Balbiani ring protein 3-like n=1 Tax=Diabrotica virgifera virgifera TaxID=50390 RepID=A0ABM5JTC0_DIAVI|nr:kielin/chordin-like protein isoform X2 [Diabrotica virgifera virgifera]
MHDCLCPSTPTAERRKPITTSSKNTSCFTTSDNNCNNNCSRCDILYSCTNFPDKSISHYTTATGEDCSCLNCVCSEMEIQNQTCDCVTCVCSVCFENGKKAPYTTYIPSTTCDCQNCVCSVCPSPAGQPKDRGDKGITAPRSGLQPIEQSKGQTYSFCKCLTCDVDGREPNFHNPQLECNCNICKCSPCTHQVHTEHTQKVHTEHTQKVHTEHFVGESTGRTSSFCKCLTCDVDGTELQSFHNPQLECNCNICKCSPCTNPNKALKTIASSNTRDLLTDQCKCFTCQDATMHKPDFFKTKVSCNCAKCECDPCADEDKRRQLETKQGGTIAVLGSNLPSTGVDYCPCTNTCTCLTCQDASMHKPDFFKTRVSCNCLECRCDPCIAENKQRHIPRHIEEGENQLVCSNDDCHCDPCPDSTKAVYKNQVEIVEQTKGEPCDCYICKCSMCKDPNVTQAKGDITRETQISKCHCTKCTCEPGDPAIHPITLKEDKTRNCNCVTCTCSPCDFPNSAQQALNCQCIVCQCSLCQLTNDQLPVSPLMPCNCTVCKCNPCGDPNKYRDQIDHEPHLAGCDCLTCTCNPCADPAVQRSKQPDQLIQEAGHPQQFGAHEMKNCNCVQCCCKGSTAEQREKKVDATDEEVPCSCPICMCKKDKNTHGKGDEIYADEKMVESKYKSTPSSKCTCETCRCGDGTKQLAKTDVPIQITRSIHDRDCICKECLCEELQKTSTIEFVKCHCSTCNCVDCLFRQPEPQRKIQDRTITKIPTHCTCRDKMANECICKECKSFSDVSTELDDKATNSLCSCSACSCLTCHTKKVENIENMKCYCEKCKCENCKFIKYQTREFNIKEELGDNKNLCTCSPCSCTDCVLNNKIEGKAIKNNNPCPILEAKCTCVEIPMSQPTRIEQQSEYVPNVPKMKQHHSYAAYHAFVDPIHVHKKLQNLTSLPETEKIKAAKGQKIEAENLYNYLPILLPQSAMPVRTQAKRKKNYKSSKSKKARGLTRSAELSRFKQFGLSRSKPIPYSEEVFPVSQSDVTNNRTIFHQLDPNLPEKPYDLTGNNKSFLKDKCKYEEQIKILKKTLNKIKGLKEKYAHNSHKRSVFKKSCEYEESISEISTAFKNLKKHCKADDKTIKELTEELKRYTSSTTFFNISTSVQQESEYDHTVTELSVDIQQQFPCYNPLRTSVPNIPVVQQETVKIRPATATLGQRRRGNICDCALCTNAHPDIYSNTGYKISSRHSKLIRTINYDTFNKPNTLSHNLALTCKEDKRESEFPPYYILQPYCLTKENIPVECENHHETEMINAPDFVQPAAGLNETVNTWRNKCATDNANDIKMTKNVETQSFDRPKFNGVACKCGKYHKDNRFVNLTGFKVINVKRITVDSIVVEWKCPKSKAVTGYDIEINGKQKSKILSGWRTCAMIHSVDLSSVLYISIYAITPCGRCEPPAKAIYEIKQKSK